jgi:hypothetical protein
MAWKLGVCFSDAKGKDVTVFEIRQFNGIGNGCSLNNMAAIFGRVCRHVLHIRGCTNVGVGDMTHDCTVVKFTWTVKAVVSDRMCFDLDKPWSPSDLKS